MHSCTVMDPLEHRLLQDFVAHRSDDAFRQLVERHVDMVYHTALRRTGQSCLADDVTQQVFTILARKAPKLKAGFGLGGWLHRTTLFEEAKTLRSEHRRHAKMKELAAEQQSARTTRPDSPDEGPLPALDEAIESLAEKDRQAILLRFFEGQSFRAIGQSMGKSEDASQKQVSRALAKLNTLLVRRGYATSAASLTALLTSESAKAAPAALSQGVSAAAMSGLSSVTTTTLLTNTIATMSYAKTKLTLALTALAALPVGYQWNRIQDLESQLVQSVPRSEFVASAQELAKATEALTAARSHVAELTQQNEALVASANGGKPSEERPFPSVADMFEDPAMQGVIRQQIEGQIKTMFGDLLESFEFPAAEHAELESMLIEKMMLAATKGLRAMDKSLSSDERQMIAASVKDDLEAYDDRLRERFGDEVADKVKLYEESAGERQELTTFKSALAVEGLELPFETEEALMAVMYEERKAFDFTHNLQDMNDGSYLASLNEATYVAIEREYEQLHDQIRSKVGHLLDPQALEIFETNQAKNLELVVGTMRMSQQMLGGGQ